LQILIPLYLLSINGIFILWGMGRKASQWKFRTIYGLKVIGKGMEHHLPGGRERGSNE
jgi:uncharacterized membrane protein